MCGGNTSLHFVKSTGMDITPTGMFRTCSRCGYEEKIDSLDDRNRADAMEKDWAVHEAKSKLQ